MRQLLNITKALADENRVRILMALRGGELCVCQITEMFGLAPSTVSKHLSILYQADLVDSRKEGRWMFYRLSDLKAVAGAGPVIGWIANCVQNDPRIVKDAKLLKKILKLDPSELCKRQCGK